MKVNEVISEGILDSIGRGLSTVGRGLARGMGVQPDNDQRLKDLAVTADKKTRKELPKLAKKEFDRVIANSGINLANARTFDKDQLGQYLKDFAVYYFASGFQDPIRSHLTDEIQNLSLPLNLTNASIEQFFNLVNEVRSNAVDNAGALTRIVQSPITANTTANITANTTTTSTSTKSTPSTTPGGVTVVAAGSGAIHVRYRNQDYVLVELKDSAGNVVGEQWQNMMSGKKIPQTLADFLTRELNTT